jgi:outer membrane lipoprotein SlyB
MKYINGKYYTDAEIETLIEKNRDSKIDDVLLSAAIGALTGSAVVGGLIGGSLLGGFLGDVMEGIDDSWL